MLYPSSWLSAISETIASNNLRRGCFWIYFSHEETIENLEQRRSFYWFFELKFIIRDIIKTHMLEDLIILTGRHLYYHRVCCSIKDFHTPLLYPKQEEVNYIFSSLILYFILPFYIVADEVKTKTLL